MMKNTENENRSTETHWRSLYETWKTTGYLHTDGFNAYQTLFVKKRIQGVHCWAHARRQSMNIVKTSRKSGLAHEAVKKISEF